MFCMVATRNSDYFSVHLLTLVVFITRLVVTARYEVSV